MMSSYHLLVKQVQKILKIGTPTNFGSRNSNMTMVFEIDDVLIKYTKNDEVKNMGVLNVIPYMLSGILRFILKFAVLFFVLSKSTTKPCTFSSWNLSFHY